MAATNLEQMQKEFGISEIQFGQGNGGLTKALITTAAGSAEIYLHGGHVTHFQPRGQQPVLYMSSASLFRPDKAIRGGIPICWPWFGANPTNEKLPMHGFARVNEWAVEATHRIDSENASITLRLDANEAIKSAWPCEFSARLTLTVGAALQLELEMTNRDKAGLLVSEALHTYFLVGDVEQITLAGLTGTSYFDKVANARKLESRDPVKLSAETDNVYLNTRAGVTLNDPVMGRKIRVEKNGSSSTVVWNPFENRAKSMADIGAGEWKKFVCVEAVNALENTVTVAPGATHKIATTIKVM